GVSLGFAVLIARTFPVAGPMIRNLVVGAVVVNQILGPIAFKFALVKTGETARARSGAVESA
ncbi:sodium:proton exchanger, partial [bacterium]|nr:sodium:proton exchanger [candidate division CSSED10-310 bacterium]